jgi:hypothetical protein
MNYDRFRGYVEENFEVNVDEAFNEKLEGLITSLAQEARDKKIRPEDITSTYNETSEKFLAPIDKLLMQRFGLLTKIGFWEYDALNAAVMVSPLTARHPYVVIPNRQEVILGEKFLESTIKLSLNPGRVDFNSGKLSGGFSEIEHQMFLTIPLLKSGELSVKEITAVLMHEIGHAITWLSASSRLLYANQVMQRFVERSKGAKAPPRVVKAMLDELEEGQVLSSGEIDDILTSEDDLVVGNKISLAIAKNVVEHIEGSYQISTSSESMADSFATRMGYGEHLASALVTLYGGTAEASYGVTVAQQRLLYVLDALALIWNIGVGAATVVGGEAFLVVFGAMMILDGIGAVWASLDAAVGNRKLYPTYDNPTVRINRVRLQMIDNVKSGKMNPQQVSREIVAIRALGKHLEGRAPRTHLLTPLFEYLSPSSTRANNEAAKTRLLEELANNNLNIAHHQLSSLKV